ncbi:GIY-YIG nuclease family protein [Rubrobacter calidifluminis]|uniref:GIY-YIG nuclease family protein n=1 Tax=Rubrobacter calidifluminis TaxID=1392640 RepID=UPI00235F1C81|nr:GIY-YIG nuclease family protein [Rubrobacter calidifluminis]
MARAFSYEGYRDRARHEYGYVYLLECANTGWHKVGWTLQHPEKRLLSIREEFQEGFDWRLIGWITCFDPPGVEATLHTLLAHRRVTKRREWFVLSEAEANLLRLLFDVGDVEARVFEAAFREGISVGRFLQENDTYDDLLWERERLEAPSLFEPTFFPESLLEPVSPRQRKALI